MVDNINTGSAVVKTGRVFGFDEQLEAIALEIESQERGAIMGIAKLITKAHELFSYRRNDGFIGWVQKRLGYSSSTAYRLLDLDKRFGNGECFPNWETLSLSALYLLAPPAIPKEAIERVAEHVAAGETPSVAEVKKIVDRVKQKTTDGATKTGEIAAASADENKRAKRPKRVAQIGPAVEDNTAAESAEKRKADYAAMDAAAEQAATEETCAATEVGAGQVAAEETLEAHWDRSTEAARADFVRSRSDEIREAMTGKSGKSPTKRKASCKPKKKTLKNSAHERGHRSRH
jgi:hypothetical protein